MKKAVALKYPQGVEAPIVVAKSFGKNAEQMIEFAKAGQIPVFEDEILVDMLGFSAEGSLVPEETFEILAQIFSVILKDENNS